MSTTAQSESAPAGDASKPARQVYRPKAEAAVHFMAVILAASSAMLASNNWCFVAVPAAFVALLVDCADITVRPFFKLRLVLAVLVGVVIGLLLRIGPEWAFQEAFGVDPPEGIRDVTISRHYVGGPGEHVLIIEFTADESALNALTSLRPAILNSDRLQRWRASGSSWAKAFDVFVSPSLSMNARASWERLRSIQSPEVFDFGAVEELAGNLILFLEPRTGRCVALHVRF